MLPNDLPPWDVVYGQMRRWLRAGVFEQMTHDLRELLRLAEGRETQPTAAILDSRTLQSTPESGARAGFDGAKKKKGSKVHIAVDTLGHLLALHVTPANEQDRAQVAALAEQIQEVTGDHVELAFVDQGYTGESARAAAAAYGIQIGSSEAKETRPGFHSLAAPLGRGTLAGVDGTFPPFGARLRTPGGMPGRVPLHRVYLSLGPAVCNSDESVKIINRL